MHTLAMLGVPNASFRLRYTEAKHARRLPTQRFSFADASPNRTDIGYPERCAEPDINCPRKVGQAVCIHSTTLPAQAARTAARSWARADRLDVMVTRSSDGSPKDVNRVSVRMAIQCKRSRSVNLEPLAP